MEVEDLTSEWVKKNFPHGARIASGELEMSVPLVGVEVLRHEDLDPVFFGWAYPNKDMYFPVEAIHENEHGYVLRSEGTDYLVTPLPEKEGKTISAEMESV